MALMWKKFASFKFKWGFLIVRKFKKGLALITGTTSGVGLNSIEPLIKFGRDVLV